MSKERELQANQIPTHVPLLIETQNLLAQPEQDEYLAGWAYQKADAMINERNKHHKERHETFGEEL